jgi:hypothetical protein
MLPRKALSVAPIWAIGFLRLLRRDAVARRRGEPVNHPKTRCDSAILRAVAATAGGVHAVGADRTARCVSPDIQRMLGYSIRPPFVGAVDGMHPLRLLDDAEPN